MRRKLSSAEAGELRRGMVVRLDGRIHVVRDSYLSAWMHARVRMLCQETFMIVDDGEVEWEPGAVTCNECLLRELGK